MRLAAGAPCLVERMTIGPSSPSPVTRSRLAGYFSWRGPFVPDAQDIGDTLTRRGVTLSLGGRTYDPDAPIGKMFFNILATFAEFEVDLIRMRTREAWPSPERKAS